MLDLERRTTVEVLFNGAWSKHGVVQHVCRGCCSSREMTLLTMQTLGIDSLWPKELALVDRKGFTGLREVTAQLVLLASVNGILQLAILRVYGSGVGGIAASSEIVPFEPPVAQPVEGEREVDGVPVNIYKEDDHSQQQGMLTFWRSRDEVFNFLIFCDLYHGFAKLVTGESHKTSREYENNQRDSRVRTGVGRTQLLEANECADERAFLDRLSDMVFTDDAFLSVGCGPCTEHDQLRCYVHSTKLGAAIYTLTIVKQRWFPFLWAKYQSEFVQDKVKNLPCVCDQYGEDQHAFYGPENIGGGVWQCELEAVTEEALPNTSSTEREHAVNERRAGTRRHSIPLKSSEVSAFSVSRQCARLEISSVDPRGPEPYASLEDKPTAGASGEARSGDDVLCDVAELPLFQQVV